MRVNPTSKSHREAASELVRQARRYLRAYYLAWGPPQQAPESIDDPRRWSPGAAFREVRSIFEQEFEEPREAEPLPMDKLLDGTLALLVARTELGYAIDQSGDTAERADAYTFGDLDQMYRILKEYVVACIDAGTLPEPPVLYNANPKAPEYYAKFADRYVRKGADDYDVFDADYERGGSIPGVNLFNALGNFLLGRVSFEHVRREGGKPPYSLDAVDRNYQIIRAYVLNVLDSAEVFEPPWYDHFYATGKRELLPRPSGATRFEDPYTLNPRSSVEKLRHLMRSGKS